MAQDSPLITCIARMKPKAGAEEQALAARQRMLADFEKLDGFESATLYRVGANDQGAEENEWRDVIVFSTQEAHDGSTDCPGYKEWSALTEFLGYEYLDLV